MKSNLLSRLRSELRKIADPRKAPQMQAYMKSLMPYHGVSSPLLRGVCKQIFFAMEFENSAAWKSKVLLLWREAKYREERYAAINLTGHRSAAPFQRPPAMKMYEEMIVSGAWWDYVDDIAIHRVGPILVDYPASMKKRMRAWSTSKNLWKRRTSIICQIMAKQDTDLDLLYDCIEPSLSSSEFFLRKGIGWALRQVAWSDPKEVLRYVRRNKDCLSPLSQREALKNVTASGSRRRR